MDKSVPQNHASLTALFPELNLPASVATMVITGVSLDSRKVSHGELFVALKGANVDGRNFMVDAIRNGATAVAVESATPEQAGTIDYENQVPIISVTNLVGRVSDIAGQCYGNPSAQLKVIGVTGTNGKSTCVSLIAQLFRCLGGKAATIGTMGIEIGGVVIDDFGMTTPDAAFCQRALAQLKHENAELVAMEVSSHGLDQGRVAGIQFSAGVFTNISRDHLDYHGSIKNYAAAKEKLFQTIGLQAAIINLDDPFAPQMVAAARLHANVITYSTLHFVADFFATDLVYSTEGVEFRLVSPWGEEWVQSRLLGEFNVYNLLAAIAALYASGCDFEKLLAAVQHVQPVPGRMQKVAIASDVLVVVDYAHTPDALSQAIAATRVHASGDLWVVFGCGGDRDRGKRAIMANIAERFADRVVITSDNPRSENPQAILQEISQGFKQKNFDVIEDRQQAIQFATERASPGDVVLVAGKGHEKYQLVGSERTYFDDVEVASIALTKRAEQAVGRAEK